MTVLLIDRFYLDRPKRIRPLNSEKLHVAYDLINDILIGRSSNDLELCTFSLFGVLLAFSAY